jgi:hypothetical protein
MSASEEGVFMKITNKEVYNEICKLREENRVQHEMIMQHQRTTNGKVKLNRWIATTALSLFVSLVFFSFSLLPKIGAGGN